MTDALRPAGTAIRGAATVRKRKRLSMIGHAPRSLTVAALAVAALVSAAGCGAKEEPSPPAPTAASPVPTVPAKAGLAPIAVAAADSESEPAPIADRLAGTYTRESYGHRTLTVRPDGTATMAVDVDPFYQWMVGEKVTVEIAWELTDDGDDDRPGVHFESVSGEPKSSYDAVTNLFGTERDWRIESADDAALTLHDPADEETVVWARVKDGK